MIRISGDTYMEKVTKDTKQRIIELKDVCKEFDGVTVVDKMNFYVRKGEFVTFLGPSGCGKTTTLDRKSNV